MRVICLILFTIGLFGQDISFIRYYANEKNFIANVTMRASERRGYDHLAAYFNDYNLPVKLEYYLSNGSLDRREVMEYNEDKELVRKGEVNVDGEYIKLFVYSNKEPWSQEYQKWKFSKNEMMNFTNQYSLFYIPRGDRVSESNFCTINGLDYGKLGMGNVRILYIRKNRKIITK